MVKQRSPKPLMWVRFLLSLQVLYYGDCGEVVNASVCGTDTRGFDSHQSPFLYIIIGVQPSGKATDFDSVMRWFESSYPSFFILILMAVQPSGKARVCKTLTVGSNPTTAFCFLLNCRCGGIGRRAGLKILCPHGRVGSTPTIGISFIAMFRTHHSSQSDVFFILLNAILNVIIY